MNEPLLHSPADVFRRMLIALGKGVNPDASPVGAWPIYCGKEPNLPDNVITVYNDVGQESGRVMQGDQIQYPGFQIRLRAVSEVVGYPKLSNIAVALDNNTNRVNVTMPDTTTYRINWVERDKIIPLNQNDPTSRLYLFTLSGYMSIVKT